MDLFDVISVIMSGVALLVAISTPFMEYFLQKRIGKDEALADYLRDQIGKPLFNDLPIAIKKIHLEGHDIKNTDEATNIVRNVLKSIIFYENVDKKFYNSLKSRLQAIEDHLVENGTVKEDSDYVKFYNRLNELVAELHKTTAREMY